MIIQFDQKKDCCACTACMNICPTQAITMKADEDGFIFPKIDNDACIECGKCLKVCAYQNTPVSGREPLATYVAINKNIDTLLSSASGGIFGALANIILERNGVVFGCAYNEEMEPKHIAVDNVIDMKRIQGSKYMQSNINTTYTEVKNYLKDGRWVLFTGTPCQIAGLKSYLGKDFERLITADIICHGVPSADFFKGYIKHLEEKLKGRIVDFKFRDKSKGWGLQARSTYQARNGSIKSKIIQPNNSYYYNYFLKGDIYRESCYECKYACGSREGDFTMGDYWGVEKAHPEVETENGVSVLLVNSKKGITLIDELSKYLDLIKSTFEHARKQNGQLNKPTAKSDKRAVVLKTWRVGGYKAVAKKYYEDNKWHFRLRGIKRIIPKSVKKQFKNLLDR